MFLSNDKKPKGEVEVRVGSGGRIFCEGSGLFVYCAYIFCYGFTAPDTAMGKADSWLCGCAFKLQVSEFRSGRSREKSLVFTAAAARS